MANPNIERIESLDALEALEGEWNALLDRSSSPSVFLRHEWIATWWAVFGERFSLRVLTARDGDGALIGIAPLMVGPGPGRLRRMLDHVMVIGQQGETLAEHLDLIIEAGREAEVVSAFLASLGTDGASKTPVLLFERVPEASPNLAPLEAGLAAAGWTTERVPAGTSPYLPLPESFEALLAAKSRNFRKQYQNSGNRLAREGELTFRLAGRDVPLEEAFECLVRLHRARWEGRGGSFETDAYVRFHRELSRRLLAKDGLCLALLDVGDTTVAVRYDFVHASKLWCFQGGWLPDYDRMRVGTLLLGRVLAWGIEQGLSEYDFLSGEDSYKQRWATAERKLVDLAAFANTPRVRFYRRAVAAKHLLRRWLRLE